jgi:hypothetical protein
MTTPVKLQSEVLDWVERAMALREWALSHIPQECPKCKVDQIQYLRHSPRYVYWKCRICLYHGDVRLGSYDEQAERRKASSLADEATQRLARWEMDKDTWGPVSRSRYTRHYRDSSRAVRRDRNEGTRQSTKKSPIPNDGGTKG